MFILSMTLSAQEANAFNLAEHVPANTLIYASLGEGAKCMDEFQKLGLWQMLADDEVQALLENFGNMQCAVNSTMENMNFTSEDIKELFNGEIALAITEVALIGMPMPMVVLAWDMGKTKEKIAEQLDQMLPMVTGNMGYEEVVLHGQKVHKFVIPMLQVPMLVTFAGNALMLTNNQVYLEKVLSSDVTCEASLAEDAHYKAVLAKAKADRAGIHVYLNTEKIVELAYTIVPEAYHGAIKLGLETSGFNNLQSIMSTMTFANGEFVETFYMYFPNGKSGLMGEIFPDVPGSKKLLNHLPAKFLSIEHGNFHWNQLYTAVKKMILDNGPALWDMVTEQEKKYNISFDKLFASIGTEYLSTISCSGGLIPDVAMQLVCQDVEGMKQFMESVLALIPSEYTRKITWNGYDLTYFVFGTKREPIPVAPTLGFVEDRMIWALYPETFKNIIKGPKGQLPEEVTARLAGREPMVLEYCNLKVFVDFAYKTALPLLQSMLPVGTLPFDIAELPSPEILQKYVTNLNAFAFNEKDGFLLELYSPYSSISLFAASIALQEVMEDFVNEMTRKMFRKQYDEYDSDDEGVDIEENDVDEYDSEAYEYHDSDNEYQYDEEAVEEADEDADEDADEYDSDDED